MLVYELTAFQKVCMVVVGILSFATAGILLLRTWRPKNETFKKVVVIIRSWWLIAGACLLMLSWAFWGVIVCMFALTILALKEYLKISKVPHKTYLLVALSILAFIQYAAIGFGSLEFFMSALPVLCLWIVPGLVIFRATISNIELVTSVGFGLTLMIYYTSHIAALSTFPQLHFTADEAVYATLILVLVTWLNDVFQFISGKSFGQRKIVPDVSPNKTLAGFIGGILGTTILASLLVPRLLGIGLLQAISLGILLGFTGMFGDLSFPR